MKMYFLVNRHLSPIQKGIQSVHCALKYAKFYGDQPDYMKFIESYETVVLLDSDWDFMTTCLDDMLYRVNIHHASFKEPSLGYLLTAICFLADNRVYDFENFPDLEPTSTPNKASFDRWVTSLGGMKNVYLRDITRGAKLAY